MRCVPTPTCRPAAEGKQRPPRALCGGFFLAIEDPTMSSALAPRLLATASLLAASFVFITPPAVAAGCEPKTLQNETRFPVRAQLRGHRGTVYVKVRLDEKGHAVGTTLHKSSGHRLLDRAAEQSVRRNWVFDVSNCSSQDLQADHLVAVEYRNEEYSPTGKLAAAKKKNATDSSSLAAIPAKVSRE